MLRHRSIIFLLLLITLATFWRATACQFVDYYDDGFYVSGNSQVLGGLKPQNIAWAFAPGPTANYHPLTWLSLMLDSDLQGNGPRGYHLTNILLHALAVVLLYLALHALTGSAWRSALVAVLFAVHPLRVESVAWISERKDVLSGCLAFAAILAYAAYAHRPNWGRYLLVALLLTLGLMAKPMLVTLPFLLLLLDVWPLRRLTTLKLPPPSSHAPLCPPRPASRLALEKIPLLVLSVAFSIATFLLQYRAKAVAGIDQLPLHSRLLNIPVAYILYIWKMVWFHGLTLYFLQPWTLWQVFAAVVGLLIITFLACLRFQRYPWLAIGWLWFLGMLVPVIGLVQVGLQSMADRYSYLPTIGLLIMLVWSLPDRLVQGKAGRLACSAAVVVVVMFLGICTWRQIAYWQDSVSLFSHAAEFSPDNFFVLNTLGHALEQERGQPDQALKYFRRAADAAPNYAFAQIDLANMLQRLGQIHDDPSYFHESLQHLQQAAKVEPGSAMSDYALGALDESQGKLDLALREFQRSLQLDPDYALTHANMGDILAYQNHMDAALAQYQQALRLDPDNIAFYFLLANALAKLGRPEEILPYLQEAQGRQPGLPTIHAALGQTLLLLHRFDEAALEIKKAMQLDPGNAQYRALLARARIAGRK